MASSRKKQDEKNLKTLRELGSLAQNKYCFDCNQRGPTYVNVTIGSFVCTKCSGMLRGLTPPHRVKSISMATFTTEEIDTLKCRGNEYCKRVWLGLYEGTPPVDARDEQSVRDSMVNKYERKRYYLEPSQANLAKNGNVAVGQEAQKNGGSPPDAGRLNGTENNRRKRPEGGRSSNLVFENNVKNASDFVANFDSADIFNSTPSSCAVNNNNNNNNSGSCNGAVLQNGFANFENNSIFNGSNNGMPTPSTLTTQQQNNLIVNKSVSSAPFEDKYAALKDLDNAFKTQSTFDWSSSGSSGSLCNSSTPTGSIYSSPSPQNSMFGSPPQGQFMAMFPGQAQFESNGIANPFNGNSNPWAPNAGICAQQQQQQQQSVNPFRSNETAKVNGYVAAPQNNTQIYPVVSNGGSNYPGNPFKVGNSSNPFL